MITAILLFTVFVSFESLRTIHFRMITQCFDVSFETSRRYEVYMDDSSFTIGFHFDRLTLQVSDGKSFQRYPSAFIGKNWKQWRWQMRFFPGKFAFCRNYTLMIFFVGFPLNWVHVPPFSKESGSPKNPSKIRRNFLGGFGPGTFGDHGECEVSDLWLESSGRCGCYPRKDADSSKIPPGLKEWKISCLEIPIVLTFFTVTGWGGYRSNW